MSWASIQGHEKIIAAFTQAIGRGRLAHAYLFVGPEGIGKKLFAIELAKTLLCENRGEKLDACERCPGCVQVGAGTHPDFQLAGLPEDKHEFPISLMHEVIRNLSMKPARGRHRIAIIDDADEFNEEAANCFLKTLEEPPPRSLLILIGTSPDRQLPTIISRCQIVRFQPLPDEAIAARLVKESLVKDPQDARRLARLSAGSLGQARALADPQMWTFRQELFDRLSQPRLDSVALAERVVKFVEEAGKESAPRRQRAGLLLKFLIELIRAILLRVHGREPALADPQDVQVLMRLADRATPDQWLELLERCLEADQQIDRRLQLVLVLEALLDAMGQGLQPAASR